ncbi:MAG: hypothetical protein ACRBN8_25670 [Nannocystales bacterium]
MAAEGRSWSWITIFAAVASGCGPSVQSAGPDRDTEMSASPSGADSSSTTDAAASSSGEGVSGTTSPGTTAGASSTGQAPMNCEEGVWSGSLHWSTGFNGFSVQLTACDGGRLFIVEGLEIPSQRVCGEGGLVEVGGRLCPAESGEPVLHAESIVGPCDGECGSLGECSVFAGECVEDYVECSFTELDCPLTTKCAPWVVDGGPVFIGATCRELEQQDPDSLGEPCVAESDGQVGVDTCDVGLLCWGSDPELLPWECVEHCDPGGGTPCQNGEPCSLCPTLPSLGLCLPPGTATPIARCGG